jgi:hypothetical protein
MRDFKEACSKFKILKDDIVKKILESFFILVGFVLLSFPLCDDKHFVLCYFTMFTL